MARVLLICGFLFLILSGCVVVERRYIVAPAPPPERVEVIGVSPYPDVIWINGRWDWDGRGHRYHWREGYWRRH